MIRWLRNLIATVKRAYSMCVEKISFEENCLVFHVRDYAQLQAYVFTAEQIANFKIIENIKSTDAYVIGYAMNHYNTEKLKYSKLVTDNNLNVSLKTSYIADNSELSGNLWDICNKEHILENCKGSVIKDLIYTAYREGKQAGVAEYKTAIDFSQKENNEKIHSTNIVKLNKR